MKVHTDINNVNFPLPYMVTGHETQYDTGKGVTADYLIGRNWAEGYSDKDCDH